MRITRKLEEVGRAIDLIKTRSDLPDFLSNPKNAQKFNDLVEDIRYAFMEYQVCTPRSNPLLISNTHLRLRYKQTYATRAVKRL